MSMTLHNIRRTELVRQLKMCLEQFEVDDADIEIVRRNEVIDVAVAAREEYGKCFIYPLKKGTKMLNVAPFFGSDFHEIKAKELIEKLERQKTEDVFLSFNCENPKTVVGKVLGFYANGRTKILLFPVPVDIEDINARVHDEVSKECETAKGGVECGDCKCVGTCEILKRVNDKIERERE